MDEQINENLKKISTWKRIFFMLIFAAIGGLVRMLVWAVILLQIASVLFTGNPNGNVLKFGRSLSLYTYHILTFLTFNTETLPYPFAEWEATEELKLPEPKKRQKK
ncbi:DUF4389 domain-containing protein [Methyloglobulus sp.]|uniref:DUF4389 domain-containing protein n=1 Tax=Methyloglobulus sp. TaxID=2518622 RepID=UPI003989B84C